ncbi:MAG: tRNA (adenosine(37)-N6)-threonylcarbamoyltransferase complex ATPase subunit type 1 TsaE [Anaerolineales bacterium]
MPILAPNTVEIFSHSAEQTRRVGMRLGSMLQPGDLLCLQGDLGAGKTTFVQGLAQGWGALDAVSSPTFVLVNVYRRADGGQFFHMDAYRLESIPEAEELDFESMLAQGPLVIEWAERVRDILPPACLWIELTDLEDDRRSLRLNPTGARCERLLTDLRRAVYGAD